MKPRFMSAARAAFFGWLAGWLAGLPLQLIEAVRNADFAGTMAAPLFIEMLSLSVALWTVLTLGFACYCCCLFFFPAAWIIPPAALVAHRTLWIAASAVFGFVLMALRAHVWTVLDHDGVGLSNFWTWAAFNAIFFAVTAAQYYRQTRRILAS